MSASPTASIFRIAAWPIPRQFKIDEFVPTENVKPLAVVRRRLSLWPEKLYKTPTLRSGALLRSFKLQWNRSTRERFPQLVRDPKRRLPRFGFHPRGSSNPKPAALEPSKRFPSLSARDKRTRKQFLYGTGSSQVVSDQSQFNIR